MVHLAEMTLAQRKLLSKEELRYYLNREGQENAYFLKQEFKPISEERLEELYNDLQAEPDDPDEDLRIVLRMRTNEILKTADAEKWSITKTIDALITRYNSKPFDYKITNYYS